VLFDNVQVFQLSNNEQYDTSSGTLSVVQTGLYWFHLSAGVPPFTSVSYNIRGLSPISIGINKNNTAYGKDQVSTDGIAWVTGGSKLFVTTDYGLLSNGQVPHTAWLWLRLDVAMQPLVAFYVTSSQSWTNTNSNVTYDNVLVNEGQGWNSASNAFIAPYQGLYFFSFGIATTSSNIACITLTLNSGYVCMRNCVNETTVHNGVEVSRAAVMLSLQQDDVISGKITPSPISLPLLDYGNEQGIMYLQGFLYAPQFTSVAWSVSQKLYFVGPLDCVPFATVNVNVGNTWNSTMNTAFIRVSGIYLIDLTSYLCGNASSFYSGNAELRVVRNFYINYNPNDFIMKLSLYASTWNDWCITRSRSTLVSLNRTHHLNVAALNFNTLYASFGIPHHAFTGFLLVPS
jgi:hypothetical protein